MNVFEKNIDELIPYERNQKKHDETQIANVANSIKRFGWRQPLVIDSKDVVVIGHCRLLAAKKLGLKTVPVTVADDLTEDEIRELRIADNKTNESDWIDSILQEDIKELNFYGFDFDFVKAEEEIQEEKYTTKVSVPQYEIKGENPAYTELYDDSKTKELIREIEFSDISEEEKEFLKIAAYRHVVFSYKDIAEHYAHASKEVQELMERSALVIIDIDDAIANGYARLQDDIFQMTEGNENAE